MSSPHPIGAVDGIAMYSWPGRRAPRRTSCSAGQGSDDHAQRFLQIVPGDVGELLQLGVRALELFLRFLPLGDVKADCDDLVLL